MNKVEFLNQYGHLIGTHFNIHYFLGNSDIRIINTNIAFVELLNFYVPRSSKDGVYDPRPFEDRVVDLSSEPVRLETVRSEPAKWDLLTRKIPPLLKPIPIATDTTINCSLILDSNHLLANIKDLEKS